VTVAVVLVGALLLLFGRKLFWLFVGAAGFVAGVQLARDILAPQPDWVVLAAGVAAGLLGALLAVVVERIAVAAAGFLIGGYLLASLAGAGGYADVAAIAWVVGGLVGALLVSLVLDPALIVLSSLAGAALVTQGLALGAGVAPWAFAAALALGLLVQFAQLGGTPRPA